MLIEGPEYNECPPPTSLVKVMRREFAEGLLHSGSLRMYHLQYFQRWENAVLGDRHEGQSLYRVDAQPVETGSGNDVYAWCMSQNNVACLRLIENATAGKYDCLVVIHNPEQLFWKIWEKLGGEFLLQCGGVRYDRGDGIAREDLNSQKFQFNVFQKNRNFEADREYRVAATDCQFNRPPEGYLSLTIGDCRDIITIEPLPTVL